MSEMPLALERLRAAVNGDDFEWEVDGGSPFDDVKALIEAYDDLQAQGHTPALPDGAVAWREMECVLNDLMLTVHDCRNLPTFKLRKELRKILEPLYASPHPESGDVENLRNQLDKARGPISPDLAAAINDLIDYADDLDFTERPAPGEYDAATDIRTVCQALCDRVSETDDQECWERDVSRAEITVSVMNDLKETEERDVDFLLGQLADCLRDSDRRNAVKSFRRQMLVVAAETAQDKI